MIKSFNIRLLPFICFVLAIGIWSCTKDKDENSGQVELLSFGPTGALHGDTIRFVGHNLHKVTAIQFTGTNATVEQKDFKEQNSELIRVIVPAGAEQGMVTLKTTDGDVVSRTRFNLEVAAAITSVTPEARPGENVTIQGNFLNWVTRVTFADGKAVDTFVSKSLNQLVVKVPLDAQTGPLVLSFGGTEPKNVQSDDTLKVTLPMVTAISPNPVKHRTELTITGTNLDLAKQVKLAGVTTPITTFVSQSATQIVVTVPQSATGGKITLVAASGVATESTAEFQVQLPAITSMSPNPTDPGEELTINGTNLDLVTGIAFSGVADPITSFVSKTASRIVVRVPQGALKGKIVLNVLNSTLKVQSTNELVMKTVALVPFKSPVYEDGMNANWDKWGGWGTDAQEISNTERPYAGANAFKVVYQTSNAYGAVQFHPKNTFAFPGNHTHMRLSIYGGANTTATSRVAIYVKDGTDPTDAQKKVLTLVPGKYTTYEFPLSDFSNNPAKINELVIQNYGTPGLTIYIDEVGFF